MAAMYEYHRRKSGVALPGWRSRFSSLPTAPMPPRPLPCHTPPSQLAQPAPRSATPFHEQTPLPITLTCLISLSLLFMVQDTGRGQANTNTAPRALPLRDRTWVWTDVHWLSAFHDLTCSIHRLSSHTAAWAAPQKHAAALALLLAHHAFPLGDSTLSPAGQPVCLTHITGPSGKLDHNPVARGLHHPSGSLFKD